MKLDAETRSRIAAEYALGTLRGGARRRFEAMMRDDADLCAEARAWHERLLALYAELPDEVPSAASWTRILARTGLLDNAPTGPRVGLWNRLGLWRAATASLATLLVAVLVLPRPDTDRVPTGDPVSDQVTVPTGETPRTLVLVLSDEDARAGWVMTAERGDLAARPVRELAALDDRSYQLWLIPPGESPRSVGLIDPQRSSAFELPTELETLLAPGTTLAVSLEPLGGSPTGQPTGPVLFSGQVLEL
ncbi:anti-sigma factor [Halomonas denitrificans]|nr:anti-sigma factor [Halomonas denitrificans]